MPGSISRMKVKDLAAAIELKKALAVTPQNPTARDAFESDRDPVTGERPSGTVMRQLAEQKAAQAAEGGQDFRAGKARSERAQTTLDARKKGPRGPGEKVTDEQLARYVANVRKQHPESTSRTEFEYAYWIEKLAISSWTRWEKAWEAADPK